MNKINLIVGKIPTQINQSNDEIVFVFSDGSQGRFYHEQDCCETVVIDDVNGSWGDLIGTPLLVADERISHEDLKGREYYDSITWTFYTFRSVKGSVDVRWHGSSNGYYSEKVNFLFKRE